MSHNSANGYDVDAHVAEIYDQHETQTQDVAFLRRLLAGRGPMRILEACCGTGRILLPLALDGHTVVGMDQARAMLARARAKVRGLPEAVRQRIALSEMDVTAGGWPRGFDLVLLAGNCFYELATPEEQEGCVESATAALKPGGWLYLDNDHMEGELAEAWRRPGVHRTAFPSGTCSDGTRLEATTEVLWLDAPRRLWCARRRLTITPPDGSAQVREWEQQKHPVSVAEQRAWLHAHGFAVEAAYGDHAGAPYTEASSRGIFWARLGAGLRNEPGSGASDATMPCRA